MSDAEQPLPKIHEILYKFEQNSHRHRVEALSEKQLTTKLGTEKTLAAEAIQALWPLQPTHPVDGEQELIANIARLIGVSKHTKEVESVRKIVAAHLQAAVQAERDRWVKSSMRRLGKYDTTGIPPETQALIGAAVLEARIDEAHRAASVALIHKMDSAEQISALLSSRYEQLEQSQLKTEGKRG